MTASNTLAVKEQLHIQKLWQQKVSIDETQQIVVIDGRLYCACQPQTYEADTIDTIIVVTSVETGERLSTLRSKDTNPAQKIWKGADNLCLVCCTSTGSLIRFDLVSGCVLSIVHLPSKGADIPTTLPNPNPPPPPPPTMSYRCFVAFSDFSRVFACLNDSNDGTIVGWRVCRSASIPGAQSRSRIAEEAVQDTALRGHEAGVLTLKLSHDATFLLSGSYDQTIRVWSTKTGQCKKVFVGHGGGIRAMALSYDGRTLYSAAADNTIRAWSLEAWVCLRQMHGRHEDTTWTSCMDLGPKGTQLQHVLVSGSTGPFGCSTLKAFDVVTGECLATFSLLEIDQKGGVTALTFSDDGTMLYAAASDGSVAAWQVELRITKKSRDTLARGFFT